MLICLHSDWLGTNLNLVHERDTSVFHWTSTIPKDAWVLGAHSAKSIELVARAVGFNLPAIATEAQQKMLKTLRPKSTSQAPIHWMIPNNTYKKRLLGVLDQLWKLLDTVSCGYYGNEFIANRELLGSLERARIDRALIDNIIKREKNETIKSSLKSFIPDSSGYASRVVYNQSSSVTGRLTVQSGPNILTLKKTHRKIIKSRFPRGKIVQVDFVSLEPRVALSVAEVDQPPDVYSYIGKHVLEDSVPRSVSKIATLCALYGMSSKNLADVLDGQDAENVIGRVRDIFKINLIGRKLSREYSDEGMIFNFYNRPISPGSGLRHVLVNNFIQSSSVDAALLGFGSLVDCIVSEKINAVPLFVIHDALVLDVHPDSTSKIREILKEGIKISKFNQKFPVSFEIIN